MKNPSRVAALLDELKAECSTAFERHRVEVLRKDFFDPPKAEQVDATHQKFNGVVFVKDDTNHYRAEIGLHRLLWIYYNGNFPEGYHIHHCDLNPENNQLDNLQCLSSSDHKKIHATLEKKIEVSCSACGKKFLTIARNPSRFCSNKCRYESTKEERACSVCGKIFFARKYDKTITCSSACANILRAKAPRPTITGTCAYCGKEFTTTKTGRNKFCSTKCANRFHYEESKAPRICAYCGKEFLAAKHDDTQCCSRECGNALVGRGKQFSHEKRICPVCGTEFETYRSDPKIFCSMTCAAKGHKKKSIVCAQCGKQFEASSNRTRFCSRTCLRKYHRLRRQALNKADKYETS